MDKHTRGIVHHGNILRVVVKGPGVEAVARGLVCEGILRRELLGTSVDFFDEVGGGEACGGFVGSV